jgi:hypothetical protein
MPVNLDKPQRWKDDVAQSVDFYNDWFMRFAPATYRQARVKVTQEVEKAIQSTDNLTRLTPEMLKESPNVLPMLRMATAPPIAVDRLSGLAYVSRTLVNRMEKKGKLPTRIAESDLDAALARMCKVITTLLDEDVFPWLANVSRPSPSERRRAATIVADRLTGATADPIMRNAQEQRQLETIEAYLTKLGYRRITLSSKTALNEMETGTFVFRHNVVAALDRPVNIPIDTIVQPRQPEPDRLPLLIEAKSAGDFANTNKRRKEEATKMRQLRATYGEGVAFILFLNGYFDTPYLGYEAAEGIDWVWEHRIADLREFGI